MSPDLLALLDARVRQQHAGGRAAYLRELIRKDALGAEMGPQTHQADTDSGDTLLAEYHRLSDLAMRGTITAAQTEHLHRIERKLDTEEARGAQAQETVRSQNEISAKLDQLFALVQGVVQGYRIVPSKK